MVMQMKMMYRGLYKLFDSCPSVPYTPTVYFIILQKFDKNSYLMYKKPFAAEWCKEVWNSAAVRTAK